MAERAGLEPCLPEALADACWLPWSLPMAASDKYLHSQQSVMDWGQPLAGQPGSHQGSKR